jgi:predicted house-cleaning noncanonical NTP pyrophosphatase (MazG superfamily)
MPVYNKLVRDKIPNVIEKTGKSFTTRTLSDNEYKEVLVLKIDEEFAEYKSANDDKHAIEELADLLELLHALTAIHGFTPEDLEQVRARKVDERGGFKNKIYLIEVQDA